MLRQASRAPFSMDGGGKHRWAPPSPTDHCRILSKSVVLRRATSTLAISSGAPQDTLCLVEICIVPLRLGELCRDSTSLARNYLNL